MDDLISRRAVNNLIDELARAISDERCCISRGRSTATIMKDILDLPSAVMPTDGEYILKSDAIRVASGYCHPSNVAKEIEKLPAVRPNVGYWKKISPADIYECSECGQNVMTKDICAYHFCHGCGAHMHGDKQQ